MDSRKNANIGSLASDSARRLRTSAGLTFMAMLIGFVGFGVASAPPAAAQSGAPGAPCNNPIVTTFAMTASDQAFQTAPNTGSIQIKAWGAASSRNNNPVGLANLIAGPGGYAQADFVVSGGTDFVVVVGDSRSSSGTIVYGFGSPAVSAAAGGGLSGVFSGTAPVTSTDQALSLIHI